MSDILLETERQAARIVCDLHGNLLDDRDDSNTVIDFMIDTDVFISNESDRSTREKVIAWLAAHPDVRAIEIRIAKFTDGRSASLAARFREAGYQGELHASGDITQDLIFLLRRVGFTHFHLDLGDDESLDPAVLNPFKAYYQGAQDGSQPIWAQRQHH
ncbi:DUF934 domain-containing protein [Orrella marina]|nr:DUF934 domain-containing protein [Orrella marina]